MRWKIVGTILLALLAPSLTAAEEESAEQRSPKSPGLPFVEVNLEEGYVDLEGAVCLREGLLELAATVRGGKEHESVFSVKARPQHIHLALLLLGLEPGRPGRWIYGEETVTPIDPTGDRVRVTVLYEREGERVERPVSAFIRDRVSGETMEGNEFVFAGSRMGERPDGERYYVADGSGDVISLVSFGDEVLAWPTAASDSNEELIWEADPDQTPPLGTPVVLRLRPVAGNAPGDPAGSGRKSEADPDTGR